MEAPPALAGHWPGLQHRRHPHEPREAQVSIEGGKFCAFMRNWPLSPADFFLMFFTRICVLMRFLTHGAFLYVMSLVRSYAYLKQNQITPCMFFGCRPHMLGLFGLHSL